MIWEINDDSRGNLFLQQYHVSIQAIDFRQTDNLYLSTID